MHLECHQDFVSGKTGCWVQIINFLPDFVPVCVARGFSVDFRTSYLLVLMDDHAGLVQNRTYRDEHAIGRY